MINDFQDDRTLTQSYSIYQKDLEYMKQHNLSGTDIIRTFLQQHRQNQNKTNTEQKIELFKNRVIIVFVGILLLTISGFRSVDFPWSVLLFIGGMLFIFYGIFDLAMKLLPIVKKSWSGKQ